MVPAARVDQQDRGRQPQLGQPVGQPVDARDGRHRVGVEHGVGRPLELPDGRLEVGPRDHRHTGQGLADGRRGLLLVPGVAERPQQRHGQRHRPRLHQARALGHRLVGVERHEHRPVAVDPLADPGDALPGDHRLGVEGPHALGHPAPLGERQGVLEPGRGDQADGHPGPGGDDVGDGGGAQAEALDPGSSSLRSTPARAATRAQASRTDWPTSAGTVGDLARQTVGPSVSTASVRSRRHRFPSTRPRRTPRSTPGECTARTGRSRWPEPAVGRAGAGRPGQTGRRGPPGDDTQEVRACSRSRRSRTGWRSRTCSSATATPSTPGTGISTGPCSPRTPTSTTLEFAGAAKGTVDEIVEFLAAAMPTFKGHQHMVGNTVLEIDGDTAKARTICFNPMVMEVDGAEHVFFCGLWYRDQLVRTADGWKIKHRYEERLYQFNQPADLVPPTQ